MSHHVEEFGVSVCEDTLNMESVLSPYNFNSVPQSLHCTVCCVIDVSLHCLVCHRCVTTLSVVPQMCHCTVWCATDVSLHSLLCHRFATALSVVPQMCQCIVCCATDVSVHRLLCHRCVSALSAVPQMCHSGNVLDFCLKGTRQVEATLIIWLNNITYKETPLQ